MTVTRKTLIDESRRFAKTHDLGSGFAVAMRGHEAFHSVVRPVAGVCSKSGTPLMEVRLAWDTDVVPPDTHDGRRRESSGWTHQVKRHIDGTYCVGEYGEPEAMHADCMGQSKCPKCNQYGTLVHAQEAYLDRTTCTSRRMDGFKSCDYEHIYMIGD